MGRFKKQKCLVIQGARQTGKTYIVERFAEENYEEIVEINFKQIPSAMDIFSGDLTVDNMVMAMRFRFPEKKIIPGKTMIFLDEIQECQEAITSLKFWALLCICIILIGVQAVSLPKSAKFRLRME